MNALDGPGDTRMMGIVHDARKRDLPRARQVLLATPAPRGRQRMALVKHVTWVLGRLHVHHSGEDAALWPFFQRDRAVGVVG